MRRDAAGHASGVVLALSGLAASAGTIHVVAAVEHAGISRQLGMFFALTATAQLVAARALYRAPDDHRTLALVAGGSITVALLWIFSRTTGLPVGPDAGTVSSVGVADTIVTLQEVALAGLAAIAWRPRSRASLAWLNSAIGLRLTMCLLSVMLLMAAMGGHEH